MPTIKILIEKIKNSLKSISGDETYKILAALPFYFTWVPILTWRSTTNEVRRICLYSAINTGLFFSLLILAQLFSFFPFVGNFLSNAIHFVSIAIYLGIAGFLIYSVRFQKTIEIPIISKWEKILESNFAPIAQLDRVSDYGSEG